MNNEIGRNDNCPCGSGKKYKKCCMGKPIKRKITVLSKLKVNEIAPEIDLFQRSIDLQSKHLEAFRQSAFKTSTHSFAQGNVAFEEEKIEAPEALSEQERLERMRQQEQGMQQAIEKRQSPVFEPSTRDYTKS